jgi:hypothetical protein
MSKQKEQNKSISLQLLESCRAALYMVKDTFDEIVNDKTFKKLELGDKLDVSDRIIKITSNLGKSIETLAILEKKCEAEEQVNSKVRGQAKTSLLEDDKL